MAETAIRSVCAWNATSGASASARGKSSRGIDTVGGRKRSNRTDMASRGRKSKYDEYVKPRLEEIRRAAAAGVDDKIIAEDLGIAPQTFCEYKNKYPEFAEALRKGRARATITAWSALMKLVEGFHYDEVKEYARIGKAGKEVKGKEVTNKYCPPNPQAIAMLLRNYDESFTDKDKTTVDLKKQEAELHKLLAEAELLI